MDAVVSLLKNFDFEEMLPSLGFYVFSLKFWCFVLVMAGPAVLLTLGIFYKKRVPDGPDSFWAYRSKAAMKDRQVWNEAHRLAGDLWCKLGAVLCVAGLGVGLLIFVLPGGAAPVITLIAVCAELIVIAASRAKIDKQLKKM